MAYNYDVIPKKTRDGWVVQSRDNPDLYLTASGGASASHKAKILKSPNEIVGMFHRWGYRSEKAPKGYDMFLSSDIVQFTIEVKLCQN